MRVETKKLQSVIKDRTYLEQRASEQVSAVLHCVRHHQMTCQAGTREIMRVIKELNEAPYKSLQSVIEQIEKELQYR